MLNHGQGRSNSPPIRIAPAVSAAFAPTAVSATRSGVGETPDLAETSATRFARREELPGRAVSLLVHGVAVAVVATVLAGADRPSTVLYVGGVLMGMTHLVLVYLETRTSHILITPLAFYFAWYTIGLGVSAVYLAWLIDAGQEFALGFQLISPHELAVAYVIYLVGSWSFHLGIQLARPPSELRPPRPTFALGPVPLALGCRGPDSIARLAILDHCRLQAGPLLSALCGLALVSSMRGALNRRTWVLIAAGTLVESVLNIRSGSESLHDVLHAASVVGTG